MGGLLRIPGWEANKEPWWFQGSDAANENVVNAW